MQVCLLLASRRRRRRQFVAAAAAADASVELSLLTEQQQVARLQVAAR